MTSNQNPYQTPNAESQGRSVRKAPRLRNLAWSVPLSYVVFLGVLLPLADTGKPEFSIEVPDGLIIIHDPTHAAIVLLFTVVIYLPLLTVLLAWLYLPRR